MSLSFAVHVKGKKITVKASPATTLSTILNDACKQAGCESAGYSLTYNGKDLDMSLPCRLLGLVNGAKLDAKQSTNSPALVRVGIQLPSNERVQHNYASTVNLTYILQHIGCEYDSSTKINYLNTEITSDKFDATTLSSLGLTQGSGLLRILGTALASPVPSPSITPSPSIIPSPSPSPSITPSASITPSPSIVASPSIAPASSSSSTLRSPNPLLPSHSPNQSLPSPSISASSSPIISSSSNDKSPNLSFLPPTSSALIPPATKDQTQDVIMADVDTDTKNINSNNNNSNDNNSNSTSNNNNNTNNNNYSNYNTNNNNNTNSSADTDSTLVSADASEQTYTIPSRNLQVFLPNQAPARPNYEVPEIFYHHTAEDAQELARLEQKRKQEQMDNQVLKTKAMREAEKRQKTPKYAKTTIRVRFPDKMEVQAEFAPQEDISSLLLLVKEGLESPTPFYLYVTPPVQKLEKGTFESLGLCPSALVLFSRNDKSTSPPFLKSSLKPKEPANPTPSPSSSSSSSSLSSSSSSTTTTTTTTTTQAKSEDARRKEMEARMMARYLGKKK